MSWLVEPLSLGFVQRALLAGSLAALIAALVGTWVVIRGLSFMGDALAHGVLPGIALGVVFGFDLTLGAVASAFAMVAGINLVHRHSRLNEDTGIGLLFVGMLALGVVIISRGGSYAGSLTGILFGDALGVTTSDIVVLAAALAVAAVSSAGLYRGFLALSFNEQKAGMLGMHPRVVHIAMLSLVTMAVVTSFRTVGTLLVFGLLIAPPASAALVARRVPAMIGVACAYGVASVLVGLLASYHLDTAASATVAVVAVAAFFVTLVVKSAVRS
ncbi:MAG: zinc ABC transporter permease AztB [Acidimicrobiia bacterium]|nr:zinc ABC transporter permease AztB [Acidimicrobiia bacterium]